MQGKKSVDDKKGQNSLNRNNQGRGGGGGGTIKWKEIKISSALDIWMSLRQKKWKKVESKKGAVIEYKLLSNS